MADATDHRSPTAGMAVGPPGLAAAPRRSRSAAERREPEAFPRIDFPIPDTSRGKRSYLAARRRGADAPVASVASA